MTLFIPFPSKRRIGHAQKVAGQLAKSRSAREGQHILGRALDIHERQLRTALISEAKIEGERFDFVVSIYEECRKLGTTWRPRVPENKSPGGAA
jgi:hypothetical protein